MPINKNEIENLFKNALQTIQDEVIIEQGAGSFSKLPIEVKKQKSRQLIGKLAADVLFPITEATATAATSTFNHHVKGEASDTGFVLQYIIPEKELPEITYGIYITLSDHYNVFNVYEEFNEKPLITETIRTDELTEDKLLKLLTGFIKKVIQEITVLKPPIDSILGLKKIQDGEQNHDL